MKEMKIILSEKRRNLVDDILKEYSIAPRIFISEATSDSSSKEREVQWSFYVQNDYTNSLIERLKNVGVGSTYGAVSMAPVEFFISSDTDTTKGEKSFGVNLEEIIFSLQGSYFNIMYAILAILSGILAGYGIANNSDVIIIGSMIVAPLLGPIALTSVGLLTPRRGILYSGIKTEVAGLLITIITGLVVGVSIIFVNTSLGSSALGSLTTTHLWINVCGNTQMSSRTRLDYATIVLAIFSGLAAGIIISKGMSVDIIGVAIAASICPPAANIGLNAAVYLVHLVNPQMFQGSTVTNFASPVILSTAFLILNIFLINVTITIALWIMGVASKSGITRRRKSGVIRNNVAWIALLMIIVFILIIMFGPFTSNLNTVNHFCSTA